MNEADRRVRYVEEGDGATLPLIDANALRIATDKIRTCVGVYFQVNHTQCFVAHIDARTPEVWPEQAVSIAGGLEIGSQVKRRLYGFLRQDDWNIKHPQFGRRLMFQSPNNTARTYQGIGSPSTSWFVVRAIRGFFEACSKTLYEEVESLDDELRQYNQPDHRLGRERDELADKADFLQNISVSTPIHTEFRAFVINPFNGHIYRGNALEPYWIPEAAKMQGNVTIPRSICTFGLVADASWRSVVPMYLWDQEKTSDNTRSRTSDFNWWAQTRYGYLDSDVAPSQRVVSLWRIINAGSGVGIQPDDS